jgi:AcrR family transcriptional regulator
MTAKKTPRANGARNVAEACIEAALRIIDAHGVEALSMRDIARELGVSHQAPYKHFASRDHILAEIMRREYSAFAHYLDANAASGAPQQRMRNMGAAYLAYAAEHPKRYRLMFETPLPNCEQHPALSAEAHHALGLLRACLASLPHHRSADAALIERDAVFIWSTLHGYATLLHTRVLHSALDRTHAIQTLSGHLMDCISGAIRKRV